MSRIRSVSGIEEVPEKYRGLRLRHSPRGIPGRPDFANKRRGIALFIDGCFWHGCPKHYREPKSNKGYWIPKIERNRERTRSVTRALRRAGWIVIRVWEHDLKKEMRR